MSTKLVLLMHNLVGLAPHIPDQILADEREGVIGKEFAAEVLATHAQDVIAGTTYAKQLAEFATSNPAAAANMVTVVSRVDHSRATTLVAQLVEAQRESDLQLVEQIAAHVIALYMLHMAKRRHQQKIEAESN